MKRMLIAVVAMAALTLVACGDDDSKDACMSKVNGENYLCMSGSSTAESIDACKGEQDGATLSAVSSCPSGADTSCVVEGVTYFLYDEALAALMCADYSSLTE